jgi:membrane-bound ClpP family serine protease
MNGSDAALLVLAAGVFLILYELLRPRWTVPGVLGATCVLGGLFTLWKEALMPEALLLGLVLESALFVAELASPVPFVSGVLATAGLAFTLAGATFAHAMFCIPAVLAIGTALTLTAAAAKRARLNKQDAF